MRLEAEQQRVKLVKLELAAERLAKTLRDKDHYTDGLHLIDFEKLKIEN